MEAGLSPFQAIRAGTRGAAEFMNAENEWGTVAVGRRADLILVDNNPLENLSAISHPAGVMVRGAWYSQAELKRELDKLAQRLKRKTE